MLLDKQVNGTRRGFGTLQLCVLQRATEEQVVGCAFANGQSQSWLIEILDLAIRRLHLDQISPLDDHVRLAERNLRLTYRLDGEECQIPHALLQRRENLARRIKGAHLQFDTQLGSQRDRQSHRNTLRRTICSALRQHRVTEVDGGMQHAVGREIGHHGRGDCTHRVAP
ncbi:hypothetical protein D3C81_1607860 [compost metagenome]